MSHPFSIFRWQRIGQLTCMALVLGTAASMTFAADPLAADSASGVPSQSSRWSDQGQVAGMTLQDCVEDLDSDVRPKRLRAIRTLGLFDQSAGDALRQALQHDDPAVRFLAATSLGRIGGKALEAAAEPLRQHVGDPKRKVVPQEASTKKSPASRPSDPKSGDPSQAVRVAAAYALCEAGQTDKYLGVVIDALGHPDRGMCCYAADLIGRLGNDAAAALPTLQQVYADNKPGVAGGDYHRGGAAMNAIRKIRGQ